MTINKIIALCVVLAVLTYPAFAELKSLEEAIEVGTSKAFETFFNNNEGTVADLLDMYHTKTNIRRAYMDKVFLKAAKVETLEELKTMKLSVGKAVDFANLVIKHFQEHPNGGRTGERGPTDEGEIGDYEHKEEL